MKNELMQLLLSPDNESKYLGYCMYMLELEIDPEDLGDQISKSKWIITNTTRKAICLGRKSDKSEIKDVSDYLLDRLYVGLDERKCLPIYTLYMGKYGN